MLDGSISNNASGAEPGNPEDKLNLPMGMDFLLDPSIQPPSPETTPNNPEDDPNFIDPRFAALEPVEGRIRTLQSIKDRLINENKQLKAIAEQSQGYVNMWDQLFKDQEIQDSFIATVRPELIQEIPVEQKVQQILDKEFKDFTPNPEEKDTRGSRSYYYFRREDALLNKFFAEEPGQKKVVPKLQELMAKREEDKKIGVASFQRKLAKIKKTLNWTDFDVKNFLEWRKTLDIEGEAAMLNFIGKFNMNPNLAGIERSSPATGFSANDLETKMTALFGPPKSGISR